MAQQIKTIKLDDGVLCKPTDFRDVIYEDNLHEYFDKISKCNLVSQDIIVLRDMYKEIEKIKEKLGIE